MGQWMGGRCEILVWGIAPVSALCLATSFPVLAATATRDPEEKRAETGIDISREDLSHLRVRPYVEQQVSLFADFGPADVTEMQTELGFGVAIPVSEKLLLRPSFSGSGAFFDFDGDRSAFSAYLGDGQSFNLFERLYSFEMALGGIYQLGPLLRVFDQGESNWWVFAEERNTFEWEDGAPLDEALKVGGGFGVGWQIHPRFSLAAGVRISSRVDESGVSVQPQAQFRWDIRDDMSLRSSGLGLLFEYDICPKLELQVSGSYESESYLLDDRGPVFGNAKLRMRGAPLLVALRWKPSDHWRISGGAGSVLHQKWKMESDFDDDQNGSISADPAPLLYFMVQYRF
jgi:hypothetical protein